MCVCTRTIEVNYLDRIGLLVRITFCSEALKVLHNHTLHEAELDLLREPHLEVGRSASVWPSALGNP